MYWTTHFCDLVSTALWDHSVFDVFLTSAAGRTMHGLCTVKSWEPNLFTGSISFYVCDFLHDVQRDQGPCSRIRISSPSCFQHLRAVELATVHVSTSHLQGAGWSPAPLLTSARDYYILQASHQGRRPLSMECFVARRPFKMKKSK